LAPTLVKGEGEPAKSFGCSSFDQLGIR